jgi:hypothetical protein
MTVCKNDWLEEVVEVDDGFLVKAIEGSKVMVQARMKLATPTTIQTITDVT